MPTPLHDFIDSEDRCPPARAELTSILILCCNALAYTRLCLESVFRHTRPLYELVLVDNASGDDTPAYLEEIRARTGPVRVQVIRNETNRGFPAGCNQAIAEARGRYLVFLNNDTIVTEGWLDGLHACLREEGSPVGLVGPVTNLIEYPQQIPVDYTDLDGLHAFAARRRQEFAGRRLEARVLSGYCLLALREVLEKIGNFDQRYELGYYDDHDLSLRAGDAGYRLLIAQDVFVHHFGGRTFAALGIDGRAMWHRNLERFRAKWGAARAAGYPSADKMTAREVLTVIWEGPERAVHSLAHVNRQLGSKLIERGHDVALLPVESTDPEVPVLSVPKSLSDRFHRALERPADVHVRHRWPPDFAPPAAGHWVMVQPWEFGSLPRSWVQPLTEHVDEVWVYSQHVRDCHIQSGVPADQVHVVPLGVDPARFHPRAERLLLKTGRRFKFLFVGGTIHRKGIDLLVEAYAQTFSDEDDVCLVIKDMGGNSFYRGQTAEKLIARHRSLPHAPEIEYLDGTLTEEEVAGLYTACDCLVHPYRGEGFGLPIAEAMACGLPVIVTAYGAALDFCNADNAFLIPARRVHFPQKRIADLETVDFPWLAEPEIEVLKSHLRYVVDHPDEAHAKGRAASAHIHRCFTWDLAADALEVRLQQLRHRPIRRYAGPGIAHCLLATGTNGRPNEVALCMIVKNEETNLPDCLRSAADLVAEVIVVDTGSTDRTKEMAGAFGARVLDFAWVDSFAAARNESLRHATKPWIFWLDADDRLDEDNRRKLCALFSELKDENAAYSMKCLCLPDPVHRSATAVDHVRLFRNHPELRWRYRVHEQILPAVRRLGGEVRFTDVVIHHVGYQDPAVRSRKLERDLRLLRLENAEHPNDPFTLFNLGALHHELGQNDQALSLLWHSLQRSHPSDSIVRKLYALIVQCHRQLGQRGAALVACRAGRTFYPDDAELLFQEGTLLNGLGERAAAEACFRHLLHRREAAHFASVDTGLEGYKARHNLAALYREEGRSTEAEALWREALAEQPEFGPAWLGLGELYLPQGRWPEFQEVLDRLEATADGPIEAAILRARGHMVRKEFRRARQILEESIAHEPRQLWPRVILSHALLQEGQDWDAAEKALRDVLTLDPENAGARQNLAVLLRQQGRVAELAL